MPFIESKSRRAQMDEIVKLMAELEVQADGDLHYVLYKFFKYNVERRYNVIKNYIGELNETVGMIQHRFLWPYEAEAEEKNGDV